ncbi:hypothetical protein AAFF_G00163780 [Aldrovandia affinis]|uniref:Uncharacterized protein n=1 Tax=Aldrovandia affinis TaxID=143900 RepID=A0AAD7WWG9_9TELE|nr:hypothetical protein AAFF_G00163780 [Aldrovandia affinis]
MQPLKVETPPQPHGITLGLSEWVTSRPQRHRRAVTAPIVRESGSSPAARPRQACVWATWTKEGVRAAPSQPGTGRGVGSLSPTFICTPNKSAPLVPQRGRWGRGLTLSRSIWPVAAMSCPERGTRYTQATRDVFPTHAACYLRKRLALQCGGAVTPGGKSNMNEVVGEAEKRPAGFGCTPMRRRELKVACFWSSAVSGPGAARRGPAQSRPGHIVFKAATSQNSSLNPLLHCGPKNPTHPSFTARPLLPFGSMALPYRKSVRQNGTAAAASGELMKYEGGAQEGENYREGHRERQCQGTMAFNTPGGGAYI